VKADATQLLPHPSWDNPRVHLLDDIWLMTLAAVVFATAVPWLFSGWLSIALPRMAFPMLREGLGKPA